MNEKDLSASNPGPNQTGSERFQDSVPVVSNPMIIEAKSAGKQRHSIEIKNYGESLLPNPPKQIPPFPLSEYPEQQKMLLAYSAAYCSGKQERKDSSSFPMYLNMDVPCSAFPPSAPFTPVYVPVPYPYRNSHTHPHPMFPTSPPLAFHNYSFPEYKNETYGIHPYSSPNPILLPPTVSYVMPQVPPPSHYTTEPGDLHNHPYSNCPPPYPANTSSNMWRKGPNHHVNNKYHMHNRSNVLTNASGYSRKGNHHHHHHHHHRHQDRPQHQYQQRYRRQTHRQYVHPDQAYPVSTHSSLTSGPHRGKSGKDIYATKPANAMKSGKLIKTSAQKYEKDMKNIRTGDINAVSAAVTVETGADDHPIPSSTEAHWDLDRFDVASVQHREEKDENGGKEEVELVSHFQGLELEISDVEDGGTSGSKLLTICPRPSIEIEPAVSDWVDITFADQPEKSAVGKNREDCKDQMLQTDNDVSDVSRIVSKTSSLKSCVKGDNAVSILQLSKIQSFSHASSVSSPSFSEVSSPTSLSLDDSGEGWSTQRSPAFDLQDVLDAAAHSPDATTDSTIDTAKGVDVTSPRLLSTPILPLSSRPSRTGEGSPVSNDPVIIISPFNTFQVQNHSLSQSFYKPNRCVKTEECTTILPDMNNTENLEIPVVEVDDGTDIDTDIDTDNTSDEEYDGYTDLDIIGNETAVTTSNGDVVEGVEQYFQCVALDHCPVDQEEESITRSRDDTLTCIINASNNALSQYDNTNVDIDAPATHASNEPSNEQLLNTSVVIHMDLLPDSNNDVAPRVCSESVVLPNQKTSQFATTPTSSLQSHQAIPVPAIALVSHTSSDPMCNTIAPSNTKVAADDNTFPHFALVPWSTKDSNDYSEKLATLADGTHAKSTTVGLKNESMCQVSGEAENASCHPHTYSPDHESDTENEQANVEQSAKSLEIEVFRLNPWKTTSSKTPATTQSSKERRKLYFKQQRNKKRNSTSTTSASNAAKTQEKTRNRRRNGKYHGTMTLSYTHNTIQLHSIPEYLNPHAYYPYASAYPTPNAYVSNNNPIGYYPITPPVPGPMPSAYFRPQ